MSYWGFVAVTLSIATCVPQSTAVPAVPGPQSEMSAQDRFRWVTLTAESSATPFLNSCRTCWNANAICREILEARKNTS